MTALLVAAALAGTPTVSTSYCLSGRMADGSYVRAGSVAHNGYPLGTHIWVEPAFFGRHRFTVRDRIGWGTSLDFWAPTCSRALAWGRRVVRVTQGWKNRKRVRHVLVPVSPPRLAP